VTYPGLTEGEAGEENSRNQKNFQNLTKDHEENQMTSSYS
jgi:hypothetical protein